WVVPTDQEFAAMAREVLDVQHYPDLRQYPGGPPERPYDAAGWTLPLQMGVRVVVANDALGEADRAKMKPLGAAPVTAIKPAPYDAALAQDAAAFDSVPGKGFDDAPAAAAIVPPAGRISGSGPLLHLDAAQNNTYRAINRAWQQGAKVYAHNGFAIGGLSEAQQQTLVTSLALQADRIASVDATPELKKPRIGLYQPWTASMDEGWTRWLLEQYGFTFTTLHPEDFKTPLGDRIDVLVMPDDARVPTAGTPGGGRGGRGGAPPRPENAYQLTPADLEAFDAFVRGGGTVVSLSNAGGFLIQQLKLPVRNVVAQLR